MALRGQQLLRAGVFNRGYTFTKEEREKYGLLGLLPPAVQDLELCEKRCLEALERLPVGLDKFLYLMNLQDDNETLFYYVLSKNVMKLMPFIYTPIVGEACQKYSHITSRPRGLYVSIEDKGKCEKIVANWPEAQVDVIVITDGERILGLGDLGCNGMGIPVGKLVLYVACGGSNPRRCLPIMLDVGTNKKEYLEDPLYFGLKRERVRGAEFEGVIEELFGCLRKRWPHVLIQFEDFGNTTAFHLLEHWRTKICTFNDDIQGTAGVSLAGVISACKVKKSKVRDERIVFMGAGEAGVGIADLIVAYMVREGLSLEEARKRCWLVDSKGLVVKSRTDLQHHKLNYAHEHAFIKELIDVVKTLKPTALVGVSTTPKVFTEEIVKLMASYNEHPLIFPLSNPTSKSECTAEEAFKWTNGKVMFASGSPFDNVTVNGKVYKPGQGNNAYIFPGVGMGVVACHAKHVTDEMFLAAAEALCTCVTADDFDHGLLFPPQSKIREASTIVAVAVVKEAVKRGLNQVPVPDDVDKFVRSQQYNPAFQPIA